MSITNDYYCINYSDSTTIFRGRMVFAPCDASKRMIEEPFNFYSFISQVHPHYVQTHDCKRNDTF